MVVMHVKEETQATLEHQKAAASALCASGVKGGSTAAASRAWKIQTSEPPQLVYLKEPVAAVDCFKALLQKIINR